MSTLEQQAQAEAEARIATAKPAKVVRDWYAPTFVEGALWAQSRYDTDRQISEPLRRRIRAAALTATVSRSAVDFEWPECHATKCQRNHGSTDRAMGLMAHAITEAIDNELRFETTTHPDVTEDDDTPEETAVLALATLLHRYNVHDAGTYARAARLIVEAYPALVEVLGGVEADRAA